MLQAAANSNLDDLEVMKVIDMLLGAYLSGDCGRPKVKISNVAATQQWSSVKLRVAAALELHIDECRFFHKGKILEDDMGTLFQCNIKSEEAILVHRKQPLQSIDDHNCSMSVSGSGRSIREESFSEPIHPEIDAVENGRTDASLSNEEELCDDCYANPTRNCINCGCSVCGVRDDDPDNIVCDECGLYSHWKCLDPPLSALPDDDWYCSFCKNNTDHIVRPGQKVQRSPSKKARKGDASTKWGRGMANVGHARKCTIVKDTHRGPIPGIEVGQTWKFRKQVGEDGVHRPIVGGIHGSVNTGGAVSIVIAAGYPEDEDHGDWFMYTGSGGKDLKTGNRRTGVQTFDQELTRANAALAFTCDAPINKNGAIARNWRNSKAVRVVRSAKMAKHHPKYAPEIGNRYDGIYKLVRYFWEAGRTGHRVYRYEFRRDDPIPAPWTREGKARIAELGLEMIEGKDSKENATAELTDDEVEKEGQGDSSRREISPISSNLGKRKRLHNPLATMDTFHDVAVVILCRAKNGEREPAPTTNPAKINSANRPLFKIPFELQALIDADIAQASTHQRLWSTILSQNPPNLRSFVAILQQELSCPVCQEFVQEPVTNPCGHSVCLDCMKGSVQGFGPKCPTCRAWLVDYIDDSAGGRDKGSDTRLLENMKKVWKRDVVVNERLVNVIRYYNEGYGK